MSDGPIVLFDGVCNLCHGVVHFVITHERDREPKLRFASLESEVARTLLRGRADAEPDTIVLVEGGEAFTHSTAALRIARHLRPPLSWAFAFIIVPRAVRDALYRFIARHRYRWFGRKETCPLPTPELEARFLA
jgi:predicted DCC family thiol-disulfide oxidoreductase YuxK